jgi:8-oxo-dGTP pyrophosphatase MutT (NUDIX family)
MAQNYTIFIKDKPLFIVQTETAHQYDNTFQKIHEKGDINLCSLLAKSSVPGWLLLSDDPDSCLQLLTRSHIYVPAAGGLVKNEKGEFLMIYRRQKWDLPKGKKEKAETFDECAIREVEEETGLSYLKIIKMLGSTWHIYKQDNKCCLKVTAWFLMNANNIGNLEPQTEEDIEIAEWVSPENIENKLANSYASIKEVFNQLSK